MWGIFKDSWSVRAPHAREEEQEDAAAEKLMNPGSLQPEATPSPVFYIYEPTDGQACFQRGREIYTEKCQVVIKLHG